MGWCWREGPLPRWRCISPVHWPLCPSPSVVRHLATGWEEEGEDEEKEEEEEGEEEDEEGEEEEEEEEE